MSSEDTRIPLTLLTGFLGAGKTTVLNHLIQDPSAGRIAVIMNEFGDAALDHDLIEESTEETILLKSGCLCCTHRGDLSRTMISLMARKKRGALAFDRVVIETSGIADPAPILHTLLVDDLISPNYQMDGVVTVADAATGADTLDKHSEAVTQIAMADLIVVTKSDLVTGAERDRYAARVTDINGSAKQICADHGQIPATQLFGVSALHKDVTADEVTNWLGEVLARTAPVPRLVSRQAPDAAATAFSGPQARHDHRICSASVEVDQPIPASVFDFWLDTLIALKGPDILRMKGILHVAGEDHPFVFHGVQHIFDAPIPLRSWSGKDTKSRVVVIARDMKSEDLQESLELLRMQPEDIESAIADMVLQATELPA